MLVSRLMQPVVITISPTDPCSSAAERMSEKRIGALIVVSTDNVLLGIVTERDIVRKMIAYGKAGTTVVEEIMTREVVTIDPLANIGDAARLMEAKAIKRLPVVSDNKVVGILTATDIIAHDRTFTRTLLEIKYRE